MNRFKERFNEILENEQINQVELARAIGVDKSTITGYKSGKSLPSLSVFYKICVHLDISADYLLGFSEVI